MDNKGQMSVEYLLIVVVIIVVISLVTLPLISKSIDDSNDVSHSSDAKVAATTIANAADTVYSNGPGSKRTVTLYIPKDAKDDTKITFEGKKVIVPVELSDGTIKKVNATTMYNNLTSTTLDDVSKGWHEVVVEWKNETQQITVELKDI